MNMILEYSNPFWKSVIVVYLPCAENGPLIIILNTFSYEKTVIFTLGHAKTDFVFNFLLFHVSTKK